MPYSEMSDLALLELAIWREAQNQPWDAQRGVGHVIVNRSLKAAWWNYNRSGILANVILFPYQFSSFNPKDPNQTKWPEPGDLAWPQCCAIALAITGGSDGDNTGGSLYYHDSSIGWPSAWGLQSDYVETLAVGSLLFFKPVSG